MTARVFTASSGGRSVARLRGRVMVLLLALFGVSYEAVAHEVRPALLQITLRGDHYDVLWKQPVNGDVALHLQPKLSSGALDREPDLSSVTDSFALKLWKNIPGGSAGLDGQVLAVEGLDRSITDVLVTVASADGRTIQQLLKPRATSTQLNLSEHSAPPATGYFTLGIEHILTGIDHLLFVLGLVLLVRRPGLLLKTITAFTAAHSVTLAATTFGWIHVQSSVVEALVALSIVILAVELVRRASGESGITSRYPWLIAFAFGLLHGCAFAGALAEVGLPADDITLALLLFNVGVEVGQLLFIAGMLLVLWAVARVTPAAVACMGPSRHALRDRRLRLLLVHRTFPARPQSGSQHMKNIVRLSVAALLLAAAQSGTAADSSAPDRKALFGDLHLHTSYSFDAYVLFASRVTPEQALRFAKGEPVPFLDKTVKRAEPLDFMAVTDHSENIGVFRDLDDPNSEFSKSPLGEEIRKNGTKGFWKVVGLMTSGKPLPGFDPKPVSHSAWQREIDAANSQYEPGKFTTFIAVRVELDAERQVQPAP